MIPLSEAIRISKNKANFNLRFGRPEDGDYTGAEAFLQARQGEEETGRQGNKSSSIPIGPGSILSARREASKRLFGPPPLAGAVPAGIQAANPEAYFDERSGSTVIGASGRNRNAIGGPTWSGNAMKDGQVMQNTNMATFGMPGPNERRGTIGGRATPPAPDMFGRQFGDGGGNAAGGPDPFAASPDLDPSSPYYDAAAAQKSRENAFAPGSRPRGNFADGGLVPNPGGLWHGPGGPKDDEIHAKVSPGEFEMPFEAVMFHGTKKLRTMIDEARESGDTMPSMPKSKGRAAPPMMTPGFAEGGLVPEIDAAIRDQSQAAGMNYISPGPAVPTMGGGAMSQWLFPQPGQAASRTAEGSTERAIGAFDQFMAQQPAFDRENDIRTATRQQAMERLNDPAYVAKLAAEAPNPYRSAPAMTGGVDTGMAYAPNMNDHPAFNAPDPQTLADMRARRSAIRAADTIPGMIPPTFEPQPPTATFAPRFVGAPTPNPQSPTTFMAPWEKDAARAAAADAASGRPEGVRKSDWRNFQRSPQGMMFGIQRQDQQAAEVKQDARTAVKDQQDMADRNLRIAEFQQNQERYQKAADAGDREAQLRQAQFNLDVIKTQIDEARRNKSPELRAVPTPDGNGVVYFNGNQMASGVMPAKGKEEDVLLTPEQMKEMGVVLHQYEGGKATYRRKEEPSPSIRDDGRGGFFRYENGQMVEVPKGTPGAAPAAPSAQSPRQRNAPSAGPVEFKVTAQTTREQIAALPVGSKVVMPDGSVKIKK